jgi:hypothetical protein
MTQILLPVAKNPLSVAKTPLSATNYINLIFFHTFAGE